MSSHDDRIVYWSGILAEQKASGLSVSDFCRDRTISIHSFRGWRCRLNKAGSPEAGWVTIKSAPPSPQKSLAVHVGPARIDLSSGFDPQLLREVVAALQSPC